jgi:hypothetical protein
MKPEQMTETLEQAAAQLGVRVRYETMTGETAGAGGLCKVKGQWSVIIDRRTPASDRAAMLVDALAGFDTDALFLPPQVRDALQSRRGQAKVAAPAAGAAQGDEPTAG